MQAPYKQFTAMLRLIAAFNGVAALLLTAFSLGIVGGDVDSPDLSQPIEYFLAGVAACGLAQLLLFLTQLRRAHRLRQSRAPGGRLGLFLAMLAFAGAVAGFVMGCWTAASTDGPDDGGPDGGTQQAVYAGRLPTAHCPSGQACPVLGQPGVQAHKLSIDVNPDTI